MQLSAGISHEVEIIIQALGSPGLHFSPQHIIRVPGGRVVDEKVLLVMLPDPVTGFGSSE